MEYSKIQLEEKAGLTHQLAEMQDRLNETLG
jgi:hypothetical protein